MSSDYSVIITSRNISLQIEEVLKRYPKLALIPLNDREHIEFCGSILVNRYISEFLCYRDYRIQIDVWVDRDVLPMVKVLNDQFDRSYHHLYPDGRLCIATDVDVRYRFASGFNLSDWIYEFVEPYFVSYEYYERFGSYPVGDRIAGDLGILQTYQDILQNDNPVYVICLMKLMYEDLQSNLKLGTFGSKKQFRKIDKRIQTVDPFYKNEALARNLIHDYSGCLALVSRMLESQQEEVKSTECEITANSKYTAMNPDQDKNKG